MIDYISMLYIPKRSCNREQACARTAFSCDSE